VRLTTGDACHLSLRFVRPHRLDGGAALDAAAARSAVQRTARVWRRWVRGAVGHNGRRDPLLERSAIVLKGLSNRFAGSIAAAATTSLPETMGGRRNWDYRYCWVRDSSLAVRAMSALGYSEEAEAFAGFLQRSSAGHADELQIAYGVEGARRLGESQLDLEGYRGSRPVRVGNGAARQLQLDVLGELVLLAWRWHERGNSPDDDAWRFLVEVVERAASTWREPDHGIWEQRGPARHFVHSKAMCWAALDRGLALARDCMRTAPVRRWTRQRDALRREIERRGIDRRRGVLVRDFGSRRLDAAALLVPNTGLFAADDEVMVRTADAIRDELGEGGLLRRYSSSDGLPGREGCFLACSFWLAEVLALQGRQAEAEEVFDRAASTANDLGLFSEEYDPQREAMLGNFPQALTHLSHVLAGTAISQGRSAPAAETRAGRSAQRPVTGG
jgi:GH15 family glucan-1,4-alpha-glucosidase